MVSPNYDFYNDDNTIEAGPGRYGNDPQSMSIVLQSPMYQKTWTFEPGEVRIGRRSTSDIELLGAGVSRDHFRLVVHYGKWYIVDLSTNGTYLNSDRLPKGSEVLLHPGDVIRIDNGWLKGSTFAANISFNVSFKPSMSSSQSRNLPQAPAYPGDLYLGNSWFPMQNISSIMQKHPYEPFSSISLSQYLQNHRIFLKGVSVQLLRYPDRWSLRESTSEYSSQYIDHAEALIPTQSTSIKLSNGIRLLFGQPSAAIVMAELSTLNEACSKCSNDMEKRIGYIEERDREILLGILRETNFYVPLIIAGAPIMTERARGGSFSQGDRWPQNPAFYTCTWSSTRLNVPYTPLFSDPVQLRQFFPGGGILVIPGQEIVERALDSQENYVLNPSQGCTVYLDKLFFNPQKPDSIVTDDQDPTYDPKTIVLPLNLADKARNLSNGRVQFMPYYAHQIRKDDAWFTGSIDQSNSLYTFTLELAPERFDQDDLPGAKALCRQLIELDHPAILRTILSFNDENSYLFGQPQLKFSTLSGYVNAVGALDEMTTISILTQIADLMKYLQKQDPALQISCFDPSLFFLSPTGKVIYRGFTSMQSLVSKWVKPVENNPYYAPELYTGQNSIASSFYSLGVLGLFLVSGSDPSELLAAYGANVKFLQLHILISKELQDFIRKCLRPSVDARYTDMAEFLKDLHRCRAEGSEDEYS